ncbi:MAG: K(+)-transporting ATPase subunit C [Chitinispirillaceae bacterium]|jgi:K+-transporting ATPase ATPase C chain
MKTIKHAVLMLIALTILTGIIYPFVLTGVGQVFFRGTANGSLIKRDGRVFGSFLIGRSCTSDRYFQSRPSATGYNPLPSGGSNLSPSSIALADSVALRRAAFRRANFLDSAADVPPDMLFSSGSGLDPDISGESAFLQAPRICGARHLGPSQAAKLRSIIAGLAGGSKSSILSGTRVNTLLLNFALDSLTGSL